MLKVSKRPTPKKAMPVYDGLSFERIGMSQTQSPHIGNVPIRLERTTVYQNHMYNHSKYCQAPTSEGVAGANQCREHRWILRVSRTVHVQGIECEAEENEY